MKPLLMGILNVTPDSFSDGGQFFDTQVAIEAGRRMIDEGADLIDIGGESTRPGAEPVSTEEELRRTIPVVQTLAKIAEVSIDTTKPEVARAALQEGASMVNDVSALASPKMIAICSEIRPRVAIMHMQGTPRTMQSDPHYENVVEEVRSFLVGRAQIIEREAGIPRERIWMDPGIGFGKTVAHNLLLLKHLDRLVETGYPVLIGVSRKSFLGKILGGLPVEDRLEATLAAQTYAQMKGVQMIRAHDVRSARRTIDCIAAIESV